MHRKSDLSASFTVFYNYVECQFNSKIHVLQIDEGGEFNDQNFLKHLVAKGICHQTACPKMPEQNGKAERKHRNIIDLGLSVMFHSRLPR